MLKKTLFTMGLLSTVAIAQAAVLPDLPVAIKYGTGVIDNHTIYIGLGSAGKTWYKLDTQQKDKSWQEIAEFPGAAREQATAVVLNGDIYVFGGTGKNAQGKTKVLLDSYKYEPASNTWQKLLTHSPVGLVGQVAFMHNNKAIIMGGVNQNIFNGYFDDMDVAQNNDQLKQKIIHNYFNKPIKDYFYNRHILSFDPTTLQWSNKGDFPYHGTAGSAVIVQNNHITLINGELKPGLRTADALRGEIKGEHISWQAIAPVATPDGVAGAYGGSSHGTLLFAGGASFPGSVANYDKGKYYAHAGITKHYSDIVYMYKGKKWETAGKLPAGAAYGVSIPYKDGVLLIGGEADGGKAIASSVYLHLENGKLKVE